jgi:hypothetical protein
MQDAGTIGRLFIEQTGYNAWADANGIIVLYPQAKASPFLPFNPNHDDGYVTKAGAGRRTGRTDRDRHLRHGRRLGLDAS